jgi:biotin carboxylase
MEKTLLVLGAGADQAFAIRCAKRMGLKVVTVDINPDSPGFSLADDHAVISTRDVPALKSFVDEYRSGGRPIDGVIVMGSDIPQVAADLAHQLGTPAIAMESALLSVDKYRMKRRFREMGVEVPWFSLAQSAGEVRAIAGERGYPLVIKPVDSSGARGVFRLTEGSDVSALFEESLSLSLSGRVMVEEYLEGRQISTETIMYGSKAYTPGFADRNYEMIEVFGPNIIENGGWVPSAATPEERASVEALVERGALALGVTDGVVKGDVVLAERGPVMIEMAARLSGGDFSESLIPLGCGVNIVEEAINIAIGRKPDLEKLKPRWTKAVVNRYFFPAPGRLVRIEGAEVVREKPWVEKLEFNYGPGEVVPPVRSHADRFGVFIVTGEDRGEVEERAAWVYSTVKIITEPVCRA